MVVGALVVVLVAAAVVVSGVGLARGRFAATTSTGSLFSSAVIELDVATGSGDSVALLVDAEDLTPVDVTERCVTLRLRGTLDEARMLLSGTRAGGSGLDRYIAMSVELGDGSDPDCGDFVSERAVHRGSLGELWDSGRPIVVVDRAPLGTETTIRLTFGLVDDDGAQGLDTEFWLVFEARP